MTQFIPMGYKRIYFSEVFSNVLFSLDNLPENEIEIRMCSLHLSPARDVNLRRFTH